MRAADRTRRRVCARYCIEFPIILPFHAFIIYLRKESTALRIRGKVLKGLASPYIQSMLQSRSESCNRNLRNTSTDLKIPLCKTPKGQHSFSYRGVAIWNPLSHDMEAAPSLATFTMKLKVLLKSQRSR